MEINDDLIKKLENLSKLSFSEGEREIIKKDLENILEMIDKIQEVNTDDVAPLQYVNSNVNIMREDVPNNEISNEEALKNAPSSSGPYISVPKVIDL